MKKWKLKYLFPLCSSFLLVPCVTTISCSQSLETQLNNLLNDENIINLKINETKIRDSLNKNANEPITIKDLFTANVADVITIEKSESLISWNDHLSPDDKLTFYINPKIKSIIFPSIKNLNADNKLEYIEVLIDISSGPYDNKTIIKKLDLSTIDNTVQLSVNNYFDWSNIANINNEGPIQNDLYKSLKINIKKYLNRKGIKINETDSATQLENTLSIKLSNDIEGFDLYQDDLYISFDKKQDDYIYLNIYSGKDKISNDQVIAKQLSLKMSFTIKEINEKG